MAIVPQAPESVSACRLYARLTELSNSSDGLAERVTAFISAANPLLDLIMSGPFREYTLHNPAHAKKLVHLSGHIIHPETISLLTPLEIAVIIMACYLHDMGMCLTSTEREKILADPLFEDELRKWPALWDDLLSTRKRWTESTNSSLPEVETRLFQLQEAALTAFLRPRHATQRRYDDLVSRLKESTGRRDLFSLNGVSFEAELISICMSHNLDVGVLLETSGAYEERFPRSLPIGGMQLNAQFCAGVLRIVDIMDFDRERTPRILFESLGIENRDIPGSAVTLREWNKHMAVQTVDIGEEEIVVFADSTHPSIERSVREFSQLIEREIRDTMAVLRRNTEKIVGRYKLHLPVTVRAQVRSIGYVYKDLAFQLDESAISALLMGDGLYTNKAVALRELVQNSIDACRARILVDSDSAYTPQVTVTHGSGDDERTWIVVRDNGIGMDESVLSGFFFRVGTSYYSSPEFARMSQNASVPFVPISRFGIGILSVFMIGDRLDVTTKNAFSPRADTMSRTIRIDGRFGLAFVTEEAGGEQGTTIRVRLAQRSPAAAMAFLSQAASYLRDTVRRPVVPVEVNLTGTPFTLRSGTFLRLRDDAMNRLSAINIEPVVLDLSRWSDRISGRAILFFFNNGDGTLSHRRDGTILNSETLHLYLSNFHGNRITVNGISMNLKKIGRVLGYREQRLAGAIDVEIRGERDVQYDVARHRLVGGGAAIARSELRQTIVKGLHELGVAERLDETASQALDARAVVLTDGKARTVRTITDQALLDAVRAEIPKGRWPLGLHDIIAERLGITRTIAFRAISTLISSGRVLHPDYKDE
jgi:molecular chaperone HtpG